MSMIETTASRLGVAMGSFPSIEVYCSLKVSNSKKVHRHIHRMFALHSVYVYYPLEVSNKKYYHLGVFR